MRVAPAPVAAVLTAARRNGFELGDTGVVIDVQQLDFSVGLLELQPLEPQLVVLAVGVPTAGRLVFPRLDHADDLRLERPIA